MFISGLVGRLQQGFIIFCFKATCQVASKEHVTLGRSASCTRMGQVFLLYMYDLQKNNEEHKKLEHLLVMGTNGLMKKILVTANGLLWTQK